MKYITIFLFVWLFLAVILLFFFNIFNLSYQSVKLACYSPENNSKYVISGLYNPTEDTITYYPINASQPSRDDLIVLRHEFIHHVQRNQNRLFDCSNKLLLFLDEVEAYSGENLPNYLFAKIYR